VPVLVGDAVGGSTLPGVIFYAQPMTRNVGRGVDPATAGEQKKASSMMPVGLGWGDIALRLALTVFASAVIGINRGEQRRPAGMRTTILVCLAASIAMIQVNILLPTAGKPTTSFVTMDLMRLPLGILSGMGFIGAGAIIRRGSLVEGVTTAATLWYVTVMGLCFGGGQLVLGLAALALGAVILWPLKWAERRIGVPRQASLTVAFDSGSPVDRQVAAALASGGYEVTGQSRTFTKPTGTCEIRYDLRWRDDGQTRETPDFTDDLARRSGVHRLEWRQPAAD
jgi:putative Mg2+ transporter-C (MgtC) family protein